MTPFRAVLAAMLAAVMSVAGAMIVARSVGREASDLFDVLISGPAQGLICFLAAAAAFAVAAAGVFTAFLAFIAREEEDDAGPFRRRGFPKSAPIFLIALALALVWFALRCAGEPAPAAPVAVAVEPSPASSAIADPDDGLAGGDPVAEAAPSILITTADFEWGYMDPLIRPDGARWLSSARPFQSEGDRSLLCGKAWVVVTGSASEEGPERRNAERSRLRAVAAADAARAFLDRHPDCGTTHVFGVDLGQHAAVSSGKSEAATAYQRQVLLMARSRLAGEALSREEARGEVIAQLAGGGSLEALLSGRRFTGEPALVTP